MADLGVAMQWLTVPVFVLCLISGIAAAQVAALPVVHCATPQTAAKTTFCAQSRAYDEERPKLQAEAKALVAAEGARDTHHDCPHAQSTEDFNSCFGKVLQATEGDLQRLEAIIRKLEDVPQPPRSAETQPMRSGGAELTPAQTLAEFAEVEQSWHGYRDVACRAAFHELGGGTGGPSSELECTIRLTRDHMGELDTIYGMELHL